MTDRLAVTASENTHKDSACTECSRLASRVEELESALKFAVRAVKYLHEDGIYTLGVQETMMDYDAQVEEHRCLGCEAIGHSRWPDWELAIRHNNPCRFLQFKDLVTRLLAGAHAEEKE